MFDQSFSATNFRKVFDYENRKGRYLEGKFFTELEPVTAEIKANFARLRDLRKNKAAETAAGTYHEKRKQILLKRAELKKSKETRLMELLEIASTEASTPSFSLGIQRGGIVNGKRVYTSGATASSYLALKKLQHNIRHLYRVRQGHRHQIVCQLREMLSDALPKFVIRLDLTGFYETIPRDRLLRKLANDPLLNVASKKLITRLLYDYKINFGESDGLPRGIGISADLAELYMRDFDGIIRDIPSVVYYARYVDDIVMIVVPQPNQNIRSVLKRVTKSIRDFGLTRNRDKSFVIPCETKTGGQLDFLGYRFEFGSGKVNLSLTTSKANRYKMRIAKSFEAYYRSRTTSASLARRLLLRRIRFLTSNTRLLNNKRNAMVGIYFSNSLLTSASAVSCLDAFLRSQISGLSDKGLKDRLSTFNFQKGFITRRHHQYSVKNLAAIVRAWKYAT